MFFVSLRDKFCQLVKEMVMVKKVFMGRNETEIPFTQSEIVAVLKKMKNEREIHMSEDGETIFYAY